jgi:GAF domain-containing protein
MTMDSQSTCPPARTHKDYYIALHQAALTISSSLEVEQVLQSIVTSITEAMQVKACALRLLDERTGQLHLRAVYGLSRDYLAKGPVDVEHSPIDSEALRGSPVIIQDVSTDSRFQYQQAAKHEGIVSVLCVPLELHGRMPASTTTSNAHTTALWTHSGAAPFVKIYLQVKGHSFALSRAMSLYLFSMPALSYWLNTAM